LQDEKNRPVEGRVQVGSLGLNFRSCGELDQERQESSLAEAYRGGRQGQLD
jgi:hypothetical protein